MLSACTPSRTEPKTAPDPIVTTRTITRVVCPAEVTAPPPGVIPAYVGAAIDASEAYFSWLAEHLRREKLLAQRLSDAQKDCLK